MGKVKAVLFDADGVLTVPEELFSNKYAQSKGLDTEPFKQFFRGPFQQALIGKAALKDLIQQYNDVWQWDGEVEDLLRQWCESEDLRNVPLIEYAQSLRKSGTPCYVGTNQERYRGNYMQEVMFKDLFDGFFISSEMGVMKPDIAYFEKAIDGIKAINAHVSAPQEILFFDDTPSHVEGAKRAGLQAYLFTDIEQVKELTGQ